MSAAEAVPVIRSWCSATDFPGALACSVVAAESGFDLWQQRGDGGQSVGGLSVHLPAHGGPAEQWLGPDGLRRSLDLMQGRWLQALVRHGRVGWEQAPNKEEQARWFRGFWIDAQGADWRRITREMCVEAVNQGAWAWEDYGQGAGMRTNPMAGRVGLWLRQFGDTAERTIDRILDTMRDYGGYNLLCLKVADGLTWQGQIDAHTPVRSVDGVMAISATCAARGVALCPVVVPRGRDIAGEAAMHGMIARNLGCLMTDIEPYAGFWDQAPHARIPDYTRALRQAAGDAYLVNQPDPREGPVRDARVVESAGSFDAICAQHYVGWAAVGWTNVDLEVQRFDQLAGLAKDMYVTLYGVERTDLAAAFWERVKDRAGGFHCFALGPMDADQLQHFGGLPMPVDPEPEPEPEPPIDYRATAVAALRDIIQQAADDEQAAQISAALRRQDATARLARLGEQI